MRLLIRFILLSLICVTVYAFWPRTPHPGAFDPVTVARLETQAWKSAGNATSLQGAVSVYQIYDRQYGFPPFTAVTIAQNSARSLRIFRSAPDAADQEKALPLLTDNLMAIKTATKAGFDASNAARNLFTAWTQAAEPAPADALAKSIANYWALLYGKPASAFTGSASAYADALLASGLAPGQSADWTHVETSLTKAYQQLAATLKR